MTRKMKQSKIDFLDEVPENWDEIKMFYIKDSKNPYPIGDGDHGQIKPDFYIDEGIPYIRVQNISSNNNLCLDKVVFISEEIHKKNKKSHLYPKDILIAKTGATLGKAAIIPESVTQSNTTSSVGKISVDKEKADVRFVYYSLLSFPLQKKMISIASQKSAQPGFNIEDMIAFKIPFPLLKEQQKISEFLDKKTSEINKIVEKTKQSIEELEQYKKSLIFETVTKGLDKNVKMKDSGIEWIGEIPEEWKMMKIKYLFNLGRGRVISKENIENDFEEGLYPIYSSQTKRNGCLGYINTYDFEGKKITWTTDGANAGTIFLRTGKYNCTNVCGVLSPKNKNQNLDFIKYALEYTAIHHKRKDINGFKIMNNEMAEIVIACPEKSEEQKEIANFLDSKINIINNSIEKKQKLIIELEKYKQSLIYEYVTGKKEVK